jgi:hypothetical protein
MTSDERRLWEQRLETQEKRIRSLVRQTFSTSLINSTKWEEITDALRGLPLSYRAKFVDDEQVSDLGHVWSPAHGYLESARFGPFLALAVEWLEIVAVAQKPRGALVTPETVDSSTEVRRRLQAAGVPFREQDGAFCITGHIR